MLVSGSRGPARSRPAAGCRWPGLYKHVDGVDAVKRDIAVLAVRELAAELAQATAGLAGRDALVALSRAYRSYAQAHPGRYAASVRAPARGDDEHAAVGAAAVGLVATVLEGYRIEGTDMIDAVSWCPRDEQFSASVREAFRTGSSPNDFPKSTMNAPGSAASPKPNSTPPAGAASTSAETQAERLSARPALVAALPRTADGMSTSILLQRKARPTARWQAKPHCLHAESA